jgi:hypothetical protein
MYVHINLTYTYMFCICPLFKRLMEAKPFIHRGIHSSCYCIYYIVLYIPIARLRFGKHTPAQANGFNNWMSTARQRISEHTSLTTEAVFSAWSCKVVIRKCSDFDFDYRTVVQYEVKSRVSGCQPARKWAWEQRIWIESCLQNWQLQNNGKKDIRRYKEDFMCDSKSQWDC